MAIDRAGVFVGREIELQQLQNALSDAFAGQGRVIVISGEPGIGKTRLAQLITTECADRGGFAAWGHTTEEGGTSAYWLWVQPATIIGGPSAPLNIGAGDDSDKPSVVVSTDYTNFNIASGNENEEGNTN